MAETKGRVPTTYNKLSSQRCESYGVLSAVTMQVQICKFILHQRGQHIIEKITIYSDSESLINLINKWKNRTCTTKFYYSPDADTIRQIIHEYRTLRQMQMQVKFIHVRGHQDRLRRELTLPEELNVAADALATAALRIRTNPEIILPTQRVIITMDDKPISANFTSIMRDAYSTIALREHLKNANNWTDATVETIWWQPLGAAMTDRPTGQHRTLVKYFYNRMPCNRKKSILWLHIG
jgi:hypothetical protein